MQQPDIDVLLVQMQFPGMPALESNITRAWLRQYAKDYDRFEFNVRLGAGAAPLAGLDEATRRQVELISKKRADLVGYVGTYVDIIEVKDRASFSAIGQLKGYRALWQEDHPAYVVRRLIVVAQDLTPDTAKVYGTEGIVFYTVPPEYRT